MASDNKDWGKYFREMFKEGEALSSELLKDNQGLRQRLAVLEHELVALQRERDGVRTQLDELKNRFLQVEKENTEFAQRYIEVERKNSNFASLYVASYQLHSSLDYPQVIRFIAEIVINLIGAEQFAVFVYDPKGDVFLLAEGEGVDGFRCKKVPASNTFLGRLAKAGKVYVDADMARPGDEDHPIAVVPFTADQELMGVLAVYRLFVQKKGFENIDMELFELLGGHAGTALMAAQLYARAKEKATTLERVIQFMKEPGCSEESQ